MQNQNPVLVRVTQLYELQQRSTLADYRHSRGDTQQHAETQIAISIQIRKSPQHDKSQKRVQQRTEVVTTPHQGLSN
jgi:hypothetical protein